MRLLVALASLSALGCASSLEQQAERELEAGGTHEEAAQARLARAEVDPSGSAPAAKTAPAAPRAPRASDTPGGRRPGTLGHYLARALDKSPALRAAHADWRASVERIPATRRLPEPVLSYAYFVRSVETRVGPQRHRFGISQAFPWPTVLSSGADAASFEARSAQQRFEGATLSLKRRVASAFWRLWRIEHERRVQRDQQRVLMQLAEAARVRIEVGRAAFADVAQIDLAVARMADALSGLDEQERAARAELAAAIGEGGAIDDRIDDTPPTVALPAEDEATLRAAAASHPRVRALALLSEAEEERAHEASGEGMPGFAVGVDYIETGPAMQAGVPDSGKDPIIVMLSAKLPIWGGAYGAKEDAAMARSQAFRQREYAAKSDVQAEVSERLSRVRDSARRARLYRTTLVPQAESVYSAVLGSYQAGEAGLYAVLLSQRDLLDLQLMLYRAHADHAVAWADLEEAVGRAVRSKEMR